MRRYYPVAILICTILAGCGKPERPSAPVPPKPDSTAKAGPVEVAQKATNGLPVGAIQPQPAATQETAVAVNADTRRMVRSSADASDFDVRMAELIASENDTDFTEATRVCREMQEAFRDPPQANELSEVMRRLIAYKRAAPKLVVAVKNLAAGDSRTVRAAEDVLEEAEELGLIFLRHALRTKEEAIALQAGELLIALSDTRALPIFMNHIKADPGSPLGRIGTRALTIMAESLLPDMAPSCFDIVRADTGFQVPHVFEALNAVFQRVCGNDEARFNEIVCHPEGMDALRTYFGTALLSTNASALAWACERIPEVLPQMNGLRASYHTNATFSGLALERDEPPMVQIASKAFPLPGGGTNALSARWSGDLYVQRAGEYSFVLQCGPSAVQSVSFSVDGDSLARVDNWAAFGWQPKTYPKVLTEGWHTVQIDYTKADNSPDASFLFEWKGPGAVMRTRPWPAMVATLVRAASDLGSTNYATVYAARERLATASDLGRLFLFNVLNTETGVVNQQAMDVLCGRVLEIEPRVFKNLYRTALAADAEAINPAISILCEALWKRCGDDPVAFGNLVGDPDGRAKMEAHVRAALTGTDPKAVARACRNGYPFAPLMPGLHGQYHHSPSYNDLALERLDEAVNVGNRSFPLATNHQDNISVEWNGWIVIPKAGDYTFFCDAAGNYAYLYVDGKHVNSGQWWQGARVTLESGLRAFRVIYSQSQPGGQSRVSINWEGPGFGRQILSAQYLRCRPWADRLVDVSKAIADMASTNRVQAREARALLAASGDVGNLHLRNVIQHVKTSAATREAARLLVFGRDDQAPPVLLARLKTEKDAEMIVALTDALCGLVGEIEPKAYPELFTSALAKDAAAMNPYASILCVALDQVCSNSPAAFGELVGDAQGHAKLDAHVQAALISKDGEAVARASRNGYPLAPSLPGLHGRYHLETYFDRPVLERLDGVIAIENRQFPLATNQQDNISAEWTGWISITQAGDYTFPARAENGVRVFVDGRHVTDVINQHGHGRTDKVTLAPGVFPFRVQFTQNRPDAPSLVWVGWTTPANGNASVIPVDVLRCAPWDGKLSELADAVTALNSTNLPLARASRNALSAAGEVGFVYLRNAIRHAPAQTARAAAPLLSAWRDRNAPPVLLERLKAEKDAELIVALTDALCGLAGEIEPKAYPELFKAALTKDAGEMNPYTSILCAALLSIHGDVEAFNNRVKDGNGQQSLAKHVQDALASKSAEAVRRACERGAPFAPHVQGLFGRYYVGQDFRDLVLETRDARIDVPNRQFRFPEGRQDDISIRWTGFLNVDNPGEYTFFVNAHGAANVWVNDEHVAASSNWQEHKKTAVTLAKGWHKLRVEFYQGSGNSQIQLSWTPPGQPRGVIPEAVLRSPLPETVLTRIEQSVTGLAAAKPEDLAASTALLNEYGAVSVFYLHRSLRLAKPDAIAPFVTMLVEIRDASLADTLREMRKASAPLATQIDACLDALAVQGAPSQAPWFYSVMKSDTDMAFPVCGAFLSKVLQETCGNDGNRFNSLVGDPQGQATLKTYVDKLPKPVETPAP